MSMKTYQVTVREVVEVTYEVRADGVDDASDHYSDGAILGDEMISSEVVSVTEDTEVND